MRRRGLRLPLIHPPDPVLTKDEMDWIADLARERVAHDSTVIDTGQASESHIRSRMTGRDVLEKLYTAGAWRPS